MDMTIDQQVALDEALVPHASRLRIGKAIFNLDQTSRPRNRFFSGEIKKITAVNINKLHQPWRSFAAVINKCLSGKSTGYDSLRDDQMFMMIKLISRHQNTQQFGAMLHVELTNEDIRNSAAYKDSDTIMPPPMAAGTRLLTSAKGKQPTKLSKAKATGFGANEGTGIIPRVPDVPTDESDEEISWKSSDEDDDDVDDQSDADDYDDQKYEDEQDDDDHDDNDDDQDLDNDGDDVVHPKLSTHDEEVKDEESFDPIVQTSSQVENSDNESKDDESHDMNVGGDEGPDAEDDDEELYRDVNINLEEFVCVILVCYEYVQPSPDACIDSLFESTPRVDVPIMTTVVPLLVTTPTLPPPSIPIMSQSNRLREEAQAENEDFLDKLDENIQKIIKEQVKVQVSKILPKIEKTVNEQLEARVLTRSTNSSKTSYAVAADLSEMELKKILIEKMESNKSIHRSDKQRNINKALVMMRIKMKNPPLDQTGDPREEEKEKSQSQQVLQRKRHPRPLFYGFAVNRESARDVYSKRRIIVVTELQIVEWHDYKHLDWITVRRDDDKLYKFKEGNFKRLHIQYIKDMLLLLVQRKVTNLTVEERFAFNVSLRMFTRSIVIQRHIEDLQLGVESYQKKLNLTKPDTYRTDLKRKEAYTTYSNPRGFIYQKKDKQNMLMLIDELHKFSEGTLNDVRTALDNRLKGIQMKYLPQTIWRRSDKEREITMIHAIDKQLKTRRIM
nr:hypothetical protein [Tanacetum cinerariifolium]